MDDRTTIPPGGVHPREERALTASEFVSEVMLLFLLLYIGALVPEALAPSCPKPYAIPRVEPGIWENSTRAYRSLHVRELSSQHPTKKKEPADKGKEESPTVQFGGQRLT
jgi:hypothetical protein